ncbi:MULTISPECIES: methyl-accepting chemotaxis protein [Salinivibrio]|uniref:Methyl-accepting chemotaxis protein n=1 Tax=Salinivibrio siamensis TaxID=414286 RepID=A0ABX3KFN4_9GAMM|nr:MULTISPECIES: methyl-accepting chemotaxis protein [Salinivibrio]KKA45335.1 chemotaxis protein [Salinivibrio sp. KP-1]MPS32334.1 methyl-accepting chemotaxis protein [Salinivibrio sp. VYel7]MPX90080.1 methyl-accepting chemotaxis protein [Salinivibrio sp. VYel1]MPX93727.1 methyl-accepting chemotaxis protein [Salinivibrio sp. VYel9]MPX96558.1 methyl-accepting chemotaxis protein [Salinivibrio sp. VYel6]
MKLKQLTIKQKLVLAFVSAVIASTAIISYMSLSQARDIMEKRLLENELPTTLTQFRDTIDSEVNQLQSAARQLASNPVMLDIINQDITPAEETRVIKQLNVLREQYDLNDASIANRNTGQYWNQNGFLRVLTREKDSWFYNFLDSGNATMAQVFQEENGELKLFVNFQQLNGKGLAGFSRSLEDMTRFLNQFKIEQSGFVFLVNAEGLVQLHRDTNLMGEQTLSDIYGGQARSLLQKGDFNLLDTRINGEEVLLASSYVPSMDWFVIADVPAEEVYAPLNETRNQILMVSVVVGLIFIVVAVWLAATITKPIQYVANVFREIGEGEGDLRQRVDINSQDEIGQLASGFNSFVEKIHRLVSDVARTGGELRSAAEQVSSQASATQSQSEYQRDRTVQVVTAINEMGATVNEIAGNAASAASAANQASDDAASGQGVVTQARDTIARLADDMENMSKVISALAENTDSIGGILDVIRGISEQTNLLALNAAIEAARAGEQGRGFAVVADEVRSLASRTSDSTDEIQTMIDRLQQEARNAVDAMEQSRTMTAEGVNASDEASQSLNAINEQIVQISDMNTQVATATEEQSTVVNDINQNIEEINHSSQQTADTANTMAEASESLRDLSKRLDTLVGSFKL